MFHLSIFYPFPSAAGARGRIRWSVLTHIPTGRRWHFRSKRAGMVAQRTLAAAVAEGRLSILPRVPDDAPEAVAAA